jgi:hypothetical protein
LEREGGIWNGARPFRYIAPLKILIGDDQWDAVCGPVVIPGCICCGHFDAAVGAGHFFAIYHMGDVGARTKVAITPVGVVQEEERSLKA